MLVEHRTIRHEALVPLLQRHDPTILEIGCNDGEDTQKLLEYFPSARIFCFEPDPRPRRRFLARRFGPNVSLHAYAVGAADDEVKFFQSSGDGKLQPEGWDYSGSIHKPAEHLRRHPWCKFKTRITVPLTRLDTFREDQIGDRIIDFIWADVQGAEGDMIAGGQETLAQTHYLYTEFSDVAMYEGQVTLARILELLPDWRVVERFSEDVLLENTAWAR